MISIAVDPFPTDETMRALWLSAWGDAGPVSWQPIPKRSLAHIGAYEGETLVGFVNIPIIKFSVDWWNTLHQPESVFRLDGPTIDPEFLRPLLIMAIAYTFLFFTLHLMAMRNEIWRRRIAVMRRNAARAAQAGETR